MTARKPIPLSPFGFDFELDWDLEFTSGLSIAECPLFRI